MDERILLRVDFDSDSARKRIVELEAEMAKAKDAQAKLSAEFKSGKVNTEQYGTAMAASKEAIAKMATEQNGLARNLALADKATLAAAGSNTQLKAAINLLTSQYNELSEAEKANDAIGGKLQKQIAERVVAQQKYTASKNEEIKVQTLINQVQNSAAGSYDQLKAQIALLTKEYYALSTEQQKNANVGGVLSAQIKDLGEQAKELKTNIGKASLTDYIRDMNIMGVNVGQASDSFKKGAEGVEVFTKGLATSRGAAVALTAVPIILFLTGVIAFFKATDAGADKLEQGIDAVKTAFTVFFRGLSGYGQILVDIFKGGFDALVGFKEQLIGIATLDFDRIKTGSQKVKDAFDKTSESMKTNKVDLQALTQETIRAAAAQVELTKATQDLHDQEVRLSLRRAEADEQVKLAILAGRDRNQTIKERLSLLDAAGEKEKEVATQELKLAQQAVLNAQTQAFLQSGLSQLRTTNIVQNAKLLEQLNQQGKVNDSLIENTIESETKLVETRQASSEKLQQIENRRSLFLEQEEKKREEAAKKAKEVAEKLVADRLKAEQEFISRTKAEYDKQVSFTKDFYSQQETLLIESQQKGELTDRQFDDKQADRKLEMLKRQLQDAKDYGQLTGDLERQLAEAIIKIKKDALDREHQDLVNAIQRDKEWRDKWYHDRLEAIQEQENDAALEIAQKRLAGAVSDAEVQQQQLENELKAMESRRDAARENGQDLVKIDTEIANKRYEIEKFNAETTVKLEEEKYNFLSEGVNAIGKLLQITAKSSGEAAEYSKAITLFQLGLDTVRSLSQIVTLATAPDAINIASGGLAVPLKIASLSAVVLGNILQAKQLLTEATPKPPDFGLGGTPMISQPSSSITEGSQTTIHEGDEIQEGDTTNLGDTIHEGDVTHQGNTVHQGDTTTIVHGDLNQSDSKVSSVHSNTEGNESNQTINNKEGNRSSVNSWTEGDESNSSIDQRKSGGLSQKTEISQRKSVRNSSKSESNYSKSVRDSQEMESRLSLINQLLDNKSNETGNYVTVGDTVFKASKLVRNRNVRKSVVRTSLTANRSALTRKVINVGGDLHTDPSGGTMYQGRDGNKFMLQRGEQIHILKRADMQGIRELSKENIRRGGVAMRSFGLGGTVSDGGLTARVVADTGQTSKELGKVISEELRKLKIYTSVTDIDRVSASKSANQSKATF